MSHDPGANPNWGAAAPADQPMEAPAPPAPYDEPPAPREPAPVPPAETDELGARGTKTPSLLVIPR